MGYIIPDGSTSKKRPDAQWWLPTKETLGPQPPPNMGMKWVVIMKCLAGREFYMIHADMGINSEVYLYIQMTDADFSWNFLILIV